METYRERNNNNKKTKHKVENIYRQKKINK